MTTGTAPEASADSTSPTPGEKKSTQDDGVARGSALMASGSLVSRVLGVVRMSLIAALFGVNTAAGDAWQVASILPTTVYMLLAAGAINAIFVPQLTRAEQSADGGKDFIDRLLTLSFICLGVTTALTIPLAPVLVSSFASWPTDSPTFALSVKFAYTVLPAIFFYGVYTVLGQVLNAKKMFGAYGWAPALCNIVWLIGMGSFMILHPDVGTKLSDWSMSSIIIIGGSFTLGVTLQALILIVPLLRSGWRFHPKFGFRGIGLSSAGKVAGWTFAGIGVTQVALAVSSQVLTSSTGSGLGKLGYDNAFFLFMTPHGLITVSLATTLFTQMSTAAARKNIYGVRTHLRRGLRLIGVALIPTTIAALCLANAGTSIVFSGNDIQTTREVSQVFMLLSLALLPYGVMYLVQRVFYAFEDARTPFWLSFLAAVIFSIGSVAAVMLFGTEHRALGVAAAAVASDIVAALVGLRWVGQRLDDMPMIDVWESWTRALFASLTAGLGTLLVVGILQWLLPDRFGALLTLVLGGAAFLVIYVVSARWLWIRDLNDLLGPLLRRVEGLSRKKTGVQHDAASGSRKGAHRA
ncbi:lipid II flippase MurJ [Austwickia sp. TVS 96-490-7B]|uniref:murein biosynthesis integral membrane protein MurJ n=1 Tax=Austwickia sp. TVS 96-490-7B TaxID=2830843 RepID=UPI001C596BEB|nr:murein biosynthesis integral membrane protein MurJ [Austwickia sp. TVS 96-490-7B]MBW3084159.1 lipid II flippase MurJ [Austwickia sp. TVS 96-490-7B]